MQHFIAKNFSANHTFECLYNHLTKGCDFECS
jgi:hypothetical protein